jgi:DNA-directed RNA polymerase specialized sigma24 family protein
MGDEPLASAPWVREWITRAGGPGRRCERLALRDHPFGRCRAIRPVDCTPVPCPDDGRVLTRVYAAALAASGDQSVAEQVSERVILAAPGGDATTLVERAVLLAIRTAPHDAFAPMGADEREVVALARLAGATTSRVATVLGVDPGEVRALMRSGLRALLSAGGEPRTPPLPPGCGSAASPAHAGHAS